MTAELSHLTAEVSQITAEAEQRLGKLTPAQLNWKPSPAGWSVAQCLEHLIKINESFFPVMRQIAQGTYAPPWNARLPLLPGLFGSLILKAVQPTAPRKFKASPRFEPAASDLPADIVGRFAAHQRELDGLMAQSNRVDLASVVVASPVAPLATYSLQDAYRILVAHERRHLLQAERVLASPGFPVR